MPFFSWVRGTPVRLVRGVEAKLIPLGGAATEASA